MVFHQPLWGDLLQCGIDEVDDNDGRYMRQSVMIMVR